MPENKLKVTNRNEFREWLAVHSQTEKECWVVIKRGRPVDDEHFWYIDAGRAVLPDMGPHSFKIDPDIERALKDARAWSKFKAFHPLYQRVRAYNVMFYKTRNKEQYEKGLQHLIETAAKGEMFGEWNDYGRLLEGEADG